MNRSTSSKYWLLPAVLVALFLLTGCAEDEKSDAYGQFEAVETTISSQTSGELLAFNVREGAKLKEDQQVGFTDTTQLGLKKEELHSQLEATRSKITSIDAEVEVQKEQLETALRNLRRTRALAEDDAATQQQLDDAEGRVRMLRRQIEALQTQKQSVKAEINATRARINQLEQQIHDTRIVNPLYGTVLTTYVEPREFVREGQPLYKIANLDTLELRVYISGAQLPAVRLDQSVNVLVDKNVEENQRIAGRVSWIASEAEFTPRMIQTKEERVTQVYAVKVRVPNPDGILKIGMPGEVNF